MSHLLHLLTTAPAADASGLNGLIAPGGGVAVILAVLAFAAKEFRAGRRENVEGALQRVKEAESERDAVKAERDAVKAEQATDMKDLRRQLKDQREEMARVELERQEESKQLQEEIRKLHEEIRLLRESHDRQLAAREDAHREETTVLNGRLVRETAVGWRLREALAKHGIPLPQDLDPDHPGRPHLDTAGPPH